MVSRKDSHVFETKSPEETRRLGARLTKDFDLGNCISLEGELGSGKTILARGITEGLGGNPALVSSPSYVLANEYPLPGEDALVFHLDLFRMSSPAAELQELGLEEMRNYGTVVIEWGDTAECILATPFCKITIEILGEKTRRFALRFVD